MSCRVVLLEYVLRYNWVVRMLNLKTDGKAMGLDNVSNEMLKVAGHTCLPFLTALFNKIYATSSFPCPMEKGIHHYPL